MPNPTALAQAEPREVAPEHPALRLETKPQRVFAPHWTTEAGFSTTIYIRNAHISQALTARVSLILNNRTVTLAETFVDALQTIALDVKEALVESGEDPEQSGGAVIDFEAGSAGAVNAYAQVLDANRSLSFSFPFMQDGAPASGPLDGVAWFYSKAADAFVALENTTGDETAAALTLFVAGRPISLGKRPLKPHEVVTIKLPPAGGQGNADGPRSEGVRVEYAGKPGAVVAQGWIVDPQIGFSASFAFHPKSNCGCTDGTQHQYGAGIMIARGGMTAPDGNPTAGPIFSPYLALSNRSDKRLAINPIFSYEAEGTPQQARLATITLGPRQTAVVNLREAQEQGVIPPSVELGNIDLQYQGDAGALVAELASLDQAGSFVSPVRLICDGGQAATMSFWRTDGDWHSSVTIQNIARQDNNVELTISYPGGTYLLEKRIAAGATAMVSINELQQLQTPDSQGRTIPKEATLGGVNIWSPEIRNGLVINAMLTNPASKTCGQCNYPGYVTAYAVSDKQASSITPLYSGFDPHPVNQGFPVWMNVQYSMGTQGGLTPNSSTSSNQSVATVNGGLGNALNIGTTTITATVFNVFTDQACSSPHNISTSSSLSIVPQVAFQKSDGSGLPNPLRVGISATTLGGTLHNRTQHLRAVITPASAAASVTITGNNKLTVTQGSTSNGVINFDVVGKTASTSHGDATIKANYSSNVIATAAVDVVVPHNVSSSHDTTGGGLVIDNRVLDATTSPAIINLSPGQVQLETIYVRFLSVTVCDQFGGLIGEIYEGAEVSELASDGLYHTINQPLTSSSTYSDPTGAGGIQGIVAAGSAAANNWPSQPRLPAPAGCTTPATAQNISVRVDGFTLSPAIANRNFTLCGDGVSSTSPPVTLTISWP